MKLRGQPVQYRRCALAASRGEFVVSEPFGVNVTEHKTDLEARQEAERRWPGAKFALTTLTQVYGEEKTRFLGPGRMLVVIAVLGAPVGSYSDGVDHPVVGFIGGTVHGPQCVPFSPEAFPDLADKLGRHGPN